MIHIHSSRHRGVSLMYTLVVMAVMLLFCSLGVDVARVQVAKTELRRAVDSAAKYGATGFAIDAATAQKRVLDTTVDPNENPVDGQPMSYVPAQDIVLGKWDESTRVFTKVTDLTTANAIQVTGRRLASRGNAIPLSFASLFGMKTANINGMAAIGYYRPGVNVNQYVPATANPFLSGMPYGAVASQVNPHNNPDYAGNDKDPRQSPLAVAMPITGGQGYAFDSISGDARHDPNLSYFSPDGELGDIGHNNLTTNGSNSYSSTWYDQNGMADVKAPINALVGVFLSDDAPNKTDVPTFTSDDLKRAPRDYSSADARNMPVYQPKLKQIFFIGDGKTDAGVQQSFIAPPGATRLYLATWDFYEWNNNAGSRNVKVYRPGTPLLVK